MLFNYSLILSEEMDVEARLTELCEEVKVLGFLKFTLSGYFSGLCFQKLCLRKLNN